MLTRNSFIVAVVLLFTAGWASGEAISDELKEIGEKINSIIKPAPGNSTGGANRKADANADHGNSDAPGASSGSGTTATNTPKPNGTATKPQVKVTGNPGYNTGTVTLNVKNTDLGDVLQLLSIQGKRNIIPSSNVGGTITANLYNVTFNEALEAILRQVNCKHETQGKFIYIYTQKEWEVQQKANRKKVSKLFTLQYVTAEDASKFVQPKMSEAGSIVITSPVAAGFSATKGDGGAMSNAHGERMLVTDYEEKMDGITEIVKQIDTKPSQVLIEVTALQADLTDEMAFGVDWAVLAPIGIDTLTGGSSSVFSSLLSGSVSEIPAGGGQTSVGGTASGKSGIKVGVVTNNVSAFIRALDEVTDTVVMANPKITTLNRQRASILVGEKIAYLSTQVTSTSTTQTVEFLDTGTKLEVRPFVSREGGKYHVRLELSPSISSAELRDAGGVTLPDEKTQELVTNVMVPEGQTIVLGGLFKEETTITRKQVPWAGDIPLLGNAFKGQDNTVRRSEVIFLITPHVVKDDAIIATGKATAAGAETIMLGAREGLLPFSRLKMAAGHYRNALKAVDAKDTARALYDLQCALALHPVMDEALRLRERLTGHRVQNPSGSLLDTVIDQMVLEQTGVRRREIHPTVPDPAPGEPKLGLPKKKASSTSANAKGDKVSSAKTTGQGFHPFFRPIDTDEPEALKGQTDPFDSTIDLKSLFESNGKTAGSDTNDNPIKSVKDEPEADNSTPQPKSTP